MFNVNVISVLLATFVVNQNSQQSAAVDLTHEYFLPIHDIKVGDIIRVKGIIPKHGFAVNLINGPNAHTYDIALHIELLKNDLLVLIRNDDKWLYRESFTKPHNTDTNFEFAILVESTHYSLAMNGQYFGDYSHRLPLSKASYLNIRPNLDVTAISFEEGAAAKTTYLWSFWSGIKPGNVFRLKGIIPETSDGFDINFQSGRIYKFYDMPFSIIINTHDNIILFNTFKSGKWQDAESHTLPLTRRAQFDIKIVCDTSEFKVIINGSEIATFQHRMPISSIRYATVTKDFRVTSFEKSVESE